MKQTRYHFETIGSTNTWAKEHAHEFDPTALIIITADEQTAGRGRFNRKWYSPKNENLYVTFCFVVSENLNEIGNIAQLCALSAAYVLESLELIPSLKWPNDILLSQKKTGGILSETIDIDNRRWMIVGLGLNVNMSEPSCKTIDRPVTSIAIEAKKTYEISNVRELIFKKFSELLVSFFEHGFSPFFEEYEKRLNVQKGDFVQFHDNAEIVKGIFEKLNHDGSFSLILDSGKHQTFYAGEFIHNA